MTALVTVGNTKQPFGRLLYAVTAALEVLPASVIVQSGHTPFSNPRCEVVPFLGMDRFAELVRTSSTLIMHAGAGSIIHALQAGHRPIVMPRRMSLGEHIDNHQIELAEVLAAYDRIWLVHDAASLRSALIQNSSGIGRKALGAQSKAAQALRDALDELGDAGRPHQCKVDRRG
jgi:UDP-N-acetylglucosamine transferase subunit ALG13